MTRIMEFRTFTILLMCVSVLGRDLSSRDRNTPRDDSMKETEPPEGYYAFVESPNAEPPKLRPPPYADSDTDCLGTDPGKTGKGFVSVHNICGDLNKGYIPRNPMRQRVLGSSYPFELLRNHTLKFLSKTLPILKADDSLPKVAKVEAFSQNSIDTEDNRSRSKRSDRSDRSDASLPSSNSEAESTSAADSTRNGRKFCENGGGVVCMLYKAIQGEPLATAAAERRDDAPVPEYRQRTPQQDAEAPAAAYTGPPTPCPAKVEYATPVFAKNYQGVWRYVVQIPYEGYFTQTIEVTRCMQSRCHYLDGGCLSSPRWTSLLVAEIFYPDTYLEEGLQTGLPGPRDPVAGSPPPVHDFQNYQQYLQKRASGISEGRSSGGSIGQQQHCDGNDETGCFQVRLYYDWFLIPGSCKCWRPDYFNRYVRRSSSSPDL